MMNRRYQNEHNVIPRQWRRCDENNGYPLNLFFTNEATFYLYGLVNRNNYGFWSKEYPH